MINYLKPLTFSSSLAAMDLRGVGLPSLASVLIDSWSASDSVNDAWRARFWANFKVCSSMLFLVGRLDLLAAKISIKYVH